MKFVEFLNKELSGKQIQTLNEHGKNEIFTIKRIKNIKETITEPDTPQNDWWGSSEDFEYIQFEFTNGYKKQFDISDLIKIKIIC